MTLDQKIDQAQRHVDSGRRIIERQRMIVAKTGGALKCAYSILETFERTQTIFEADLADLLAKK